MDESQCGACDFERDTCGWTDLSPGSYQWKRDKDGTSSIATGPTVDHTLQTSDGMNLIEY